MQENKQEDGPQEVSGAVAEAAVDSVVEPVEPPATRASIRGLAVALTLVAVLLLGSMGAAFWFFAQVGIEARETLHSRADAQAEQVAAVEAAVSRQADAEALSSLESAMDARLDAMETRLEEGLDAAVTSSQSAVSRVADVESALGDLRDELGRDDLAWRLAEASFLMTRAQERLRIARDPEGARVAIEQADRRLARLAMPELLPVREALSEVRARLETLPTVDRVGWTLELRALSEEVSRWPLAEPGKAEVSPAPGEAEEPPAAPGQPATDPAAPWYERWPAQAWQQVSRWFDTQVAVTRDDRAAMEPPRVPVDRETRLLISALREALVDRDRVQVRSAIDALRDWTSRHYLTTAGGGQALMALLDTIDAGLDEAALPDMNAAFAALRSTGLSLPAAARDAATGEQP